jgi:hypothetical protein
MIFVIVLNVADGVANPVRHKVLNVVDGVANPVRHKINGNVC